MSKTQATALFHWHMWAVLTAKEAIATMTQGSIGYKATRFGIIRDTSNMIGFASV